MRISLNIKKNTEQNAADYFEKAKKAKKKLEGIRNTIERYSAELNRTNQEQIEIKTEQKEKSVERKKEWYEKFHWFISSEGFLCIGGRDATTNDIIVKKYVESKDLVFHTEAPGSPFFVIKIRDKKPTEKTLKEVADATVTFSRVWKLGLQTTPAYYVAPDQISKEANTGEYLTKGAFMIRGKKNFVDNRLNLAIGITKDKAIMAGPLEAIKTNCEKYVVVEQGDEKTSDVAKKIRAQIGGELDDIVRAIPAGGCKIKSK